MYKLFNDINGNLICINHLPSGKSFGAYEDNTDFQAYLAWLELGNEPLPAENT
jgi:hypothetical protein